MDGNNQIRIGLIVRMKTSETQQSEERRLLTPSEFREFVEKNASKDGEAVENAVYERDMKGEHLFFIKNDTSACEAYPIFDDNEARDFFTPSGVAQFDPTLSELVNWYCVIGPRQVADNLGITERFVTDPRLKELTSLCPELTSANLYRFGSLHYSELIEAFKSRTVNNGIGTENILEDILNSKEIANMEAWNYDFDKDSM